MAGHPDHAGNTGSYDLAIFERQVAKAGTAPPGKTGFVTKLPAEQPAKAPRQRRAEDRRHV